MSKDMGASVPDQALAVPATPLRVDGPAGFDPSRVGGVTAANYDPHYEASLMLPRLDADQRDFIRRAMPTLDVQPLSERDWNMVDMCVWLRRDVPYRVWFGGSRASSPAGRSTFDYTFEFNEAGLLLREAIAIEAAEADETRSGSAVGESAGLKGIAQTQSPSPKEE